MQQNNSTIILCLIACDSVKLFNIIYISNNYVLLHLLSYRPMSWFIHWYPTTVSYPQNTVCNAGFSINEKSVVHSMLSFYDSI